MLTHAHPMRHLLSMLQRFSMLYLLSCMQWCSLSATLHGTGAHGMLHREEPNMQALNLSTQLIALCTAALVVSCSPGCAPHLGRSY